LITNQIKFLAISGRPGTDDPSQNKEDFCCMWVAPGFCWASKSY